TLLRNPGFLLTHGGMVLLIVCTLAAAVVSQESYIQLSEGETRHYSEDYRDVELAITRQIAPDTQEVTVVSQDTLTRARMINADALPFTVHLRQTFPNTMLVATTAAASSDSAYSNTLPVEVRTVPEAIQEQTQTCLTVDVELLANGQPIGR